MIPRYTPGFGLGAAMKWLASSQHHSAVSHSELADWLGWPSLHATPVKSLREGLYGWFTHLKSRGIGGRVLMSAQVCPVVSRLVELAGFEPDFVDIDSVWPTPNAEQFAAMLDDSVSAVVVSPIYGYLPEDWAPLLEKLEGRPLILDLAQGLGLEIPDILAKRADVVGYSFGIGKGLDTGGGLLLTRTFLPIDDRCRTGTMLPLIAGMQGTLLKLLVSVGAYTFVTRGMKDVDDNDPGRLGLGAAGLANPRLYRLWQVRLADVQVEIGIARSRAADLATRDGIVQHIQAPTIYLGARPTHLRQIFRLKDAVKRDLIVHALRRDGVDCAPAGELLPTEFMPRASGRFKNAMGFRADSIRLPFLGRLNKGEYKDFVRILESNFAQHLS